METRLLCVVKGVLCVRGLDVTFAPPSYVRRGVNQLLSCHTADNRPPFLSTPPPPDLTPPLHPKLPTPPLRSDPIPPPPPSSSTPSPLWLAYLVQLLPCVAARFGWCQYHTNLYWTTQTPALFPLPFPTLLRCLLPPPPIFDLMHLLLLVVATRGFGGSQQHDSH